MTGFDGRGWPRNASRERAELDKSAQTIKCQPHFLRCNAPRRLRRDAEQPVSTDEAAFACPVLCPAAEQA